MSGMNDAVRAYTAAAVHRGLGEQEADVFRLVNGALRRARTDDDTMTRVRALADNDLLWLTVMDLMRSPSSRLPESLRASLISIGHTVQREIRREPPDIDFLITINENIASGLSGEAAPAQP
jgi:flagellar biosynthesis regulator FlaF